MRLGRDRASLGVLPRVRAERAGGNAGEGPDGFCIRFDECREAKDKAKCDNKIKPKRTTQTNNKNETKPEAIPQVS